jgi:S1-C subfamily serine protease
VGDVIVEIDGTPINTSDDVGTVLRDHKPDDSITITVHRDGDDVTVTAKLGTREA